jgi:predicted nucleic acid-binding protein
MVIFDTTVLVYAVGDEHPHREPCRQLVRAAHARVLDARTTVEVVQEFVHVRSRRRDRAEAVARAEAFVELLSPLVVAEEAHLRTGLALFGATSRLGPFDSVLAAIALAHGASLVSADRAFSGVPGLNHVIPTEQAVAELTG